MCCLFTVLVLLGPRIAGAIWWIAQPLRWIPGAFTSWIWPLLGLIFVPWTTIMYVLIAPGGLIGFDWLWLGLALFADIASYAGGGYGNRDRLSSYYPGK
jgi:hypothetical protein